MSTFSLPRLLNGGGFSKNNVVNHKYASLNRYPASQSQASTPLPTIISNGASNGGAGSVTASNSKVDILAAKRRTLNRNGSIVRNQFRGIKKQMLESQTNLLLHSMTVSLDVVIHWIFLPAMVILFARKIHIILIIIPIDLWCARLY